MKTLVIVSVRDLRSRSFGTPVCADTREMAERNFRMMLADERNKMMHDYPEDFVLMHLANYHEDSGAVVPLDAPTVIATGANPLDEKEA